MKAGLRQFLKSPAPIPPPSKGFKHILRERKGIQQTHSCQRTFRMVREKIKSVSQSCLTLGNPMDYTVRGILQVRVLEWVPFSRGSSQPRDRTQVFCIAGGFFTSWAIREALVEKKIHSKEQRDPSSNPDFTTYEQVYWCNCLRKWRQWKSSFEGYFKESVNLVKWKCPVQNKCLTEISWTWIWITLLQQTSLWF